MDEIGPAEKGRRSIHVPVVYCKLPEDAADRLEWWRGRREAQARRGIKRDVKEMLRRSIAREWRFWSA